MQNDKSKSKSKVNDESIQETKMAGLDHRIFAERKIYPASSILNPFCVRNIKAAK